MGAMLVRLGALDRTLQAKLSAHLRPDLKNVAGRIVGQIRPVAGLSGKDGLAGA